MQNSNYWKQFENTGKIEDYLNYKDVSSIPGNGKILEETQGGALVNPYAGIRMCDRNHIETGTHRGI